MRGRRTSRGFGIIPAQDPGKDLFAYLFLLIMVFAFMLLLSVDQRNPAQRAPDQTQPGRSGFQAVSPDHVATLEKSQGKLWLRYGDVRYDPLRDYDRLVQDQRMVAGEDERKQVLMIENNQQQRISLHDYLETFSALSRQGVTIAFAKAVL
jgi:hypothetical protein